MAAAVGSSESGHAQENVHVALSYNSAPQCPVYSPASCAVHCRKKKLRKLCGSNPVPLLGRLSGLRPQTQMLTDPCTLEQGAA